ncbi:hypothetical protein ASPZODRAFT_112512 [Penicilliopsis zonata CBS 506.65]|uniref:Zn(2)-C6 fungal-type domain-containing protein n=1 Tax=Penicilliopsis zonata CBS 506.65 TaxID=1073090 RepID=A0A1L9SQV3_9EURO|nr:hypothetical protein ASPZODRAFT_112512 [Penicilliopsis zonata CBS 506.65]OJJ49496.1 hypothetical protein ASPZODRAFT_112512 [Penicilliopsis zonata CBS 506.65]
MPGVPSNKACERCKRRHMKCDEGRPGCQRCATAGVECPGYVQTRKFIDQGASVRRRYAPYESGHSSSTGSSKEKTPPQHGIITFDQRPLPESHSIEGATSGSIATTATQPSPPIASGDVKKPSENTQIRFESSRQRHQLYQANIIGVGDRGSSVPSPATNSPTSINDATEVYNGPGSSFLVSTDHRPQASRVPSSGAASQRTEEEEFQDIFAKLATGKEHEIAFLVRHFSETIGSWLDLSDATKFFSVCVPIRAINSSYLRYAIAAIAAKHIGRIGGKRLADNRGFLRSRPATMEIYPNAAQVDWLFKATNYQFLAVSHMNRDISGAYDLVSSSAVLESPIETLSQWLHRQITHPTTPLPSPDSPAAAVLSKRTEDLLATVTILTFYRLLDTRLVDWQSQLVGIRPLCEALLQMQHTFTSSTCPRFSPGIRAAFWALARQDYLASYPTRRPTHLDPGNLALWRAAGIPLDDVGDLHLSQSETLDSTREDLAANGLTWLLSKVINFLAQYKQSQLAQWTAPTPTNPATHDAPTTTTWLKLCFDFQTWLEDLPETFRPSIRIEKPRNIAKSPDTSHLPFPEIFYGHPTCAAAMQHYHFGRIALLLNRPPDVVSDPSTAFHRLQGYREVTKEVDYRSREICGIALGRPPAAVQIYILPLLLAIGQCLETPDEHEIIVELLRGIQAESGWETESTVTQLEELWSCIS